MLRLTRSPATLAVLMMHPLVPAVFIARAACFVPSMAPRRFTCIGEHASMLTQCLACLMSSMPCWKTQCVGGQRVWTMRGLARHALLDHCLTQIWPCSALAAIAKQRFIGQQGIGNVTCMCARLAKLQCSIFCHASPICARLA